MNKSNIEVKNIAPIKSGPLGDSTQANSRDLLIRRNEIMLPFKSIPNIRAISIVKYEWDPVFERFGIKKRSKPASISIEESNNSKFNRYMFYKLKYLKRTNEKQYGLQVTQLLKNSSLFKYTALRHVFPRGHRDKPLGGVKRLIKRVNHLIKDRPNFDVKRVYIPKPNGKVRPLGVPSAEGRVYLCLINKFVTFRLKERISSNQHGFVPSKGTLTAGRQILKEVINSQDIVEYDFKNAFNSIKLPYMKHILYKNQMPNWLVDLIISCSLSPIKGKIKNEPKTEEGNKQIGSTNIMKVLSGQVESKTNNFEEIMHLQYKRGSRSEGFIYSEARMPGSRTRGSPLGKVVKMPTGTAQGSPVSPFIFDLCVDPIFKSGEKDNMKVLSYADDHIKYGTFLKSTSNDIRLEIPSYTGLEHEYSKSGIIKQEGVWLKPIKFLGLQYDGRSQELTAHTRNGSKLLFDKEKLLEYVDYTDKEVYYNQSKLCLVNSKEELKIDSLRSGYTDVKNVIFMDSPIPVYRIKTREYGNALSKSKYLGFVSSRLYIGSGNFEIEQDFSYTYIDGSGSKIAYDKGFSELNCFTSSTMASRHAIINLMPTNKENKRKQLERFHNIGQKKNLINKNQIPQSKYEKQLEKYYETVVKLREQSSKFISYLKGDLSYHTNLRIASQIGRDKFFSKGNEPGILVETSMEQKVSILKEIVEPTNYGGTKDSTVIKRVIPTTPQLTRLGDKRTMKGRFAPSKALVK